MPKRIQLSRKKGNASEERSSYRKEWYKSETRPKSQCHPERPHRSRGMCSSCYQKWLYQNSPNFKASKAEKNRRHRIKNAERYKSQMADYHLRKRYGLTRAELEEMKRNQNNTCALCGIKAKLQIDHCHKTGRVRELLCFACNGSLSWVEKIIDNDAWMRKAIKYVVKHRSGYA